MSLYSTKYCKFPRDKKAARVAVAKDVIKWIRAGKLRARQGAYVWGPRLHDCSPTLDSIARNCHLCAMGAVLLSAFNKFDGQGFAEIISLANDDDSVGGGNVVFQLGGLFSESQLRLMEAAFEGCHSDRSATWKFHLSIHDDNDRLMAIMQNVVDHGGTFRPEVLYEIVEK